MNPLFVPLHGLGSRQDLPLPFELVLVGAALALVASFTVLAFAWRTPRWPVGTPLRGRSLPGVSRFVDNPLTRAVVRTLALLLFAWVGLALWFGQDRVTNPVFGFLYAWMWVGLVPLALVCGPVWRVANPLRTLHRLLSRLFRLPVGGFRPLAPGAWKRLGLLPGAVGLVAFAWLELVQPDNNTLTVLRAWSLVWVLAVVGGALLWGDRWIAASDPFEVYSSLIARLSPWGRSGSTLALVNPLRNLVTAAAPRGTTAVVVALLGSTAFDSFGNTTWWIRTTQASDLPASLWGTLGLLLMIWLVAATFWLGVRGMERWLARPVPGLADIMAASVVPIVVGYALGHYFSLLVIEGQRTAILLSDPLGLGWNAFGTAELGVSTALFDHPGATALGQLLAIVSGHLLGVLVAHELAIARLSPSAAVRGQLPLLAVMVGYTVAGLLLLFSP